MDLPTCPSCGQSVLDDDAEECPFCGGAMKGGGSRKSPPAAGAQGAKKPPLSARPGATSAKSPNALTKEGSTSAKSPAPTAEVNSTKQKSSGDGLDVDEAARKSAPALALRPTEGRQHEVVCPMCETVGYTSKKAAGRMVRCANPKCLVPYFDAPPIPEEKPPPPPPPPIWKTPLGIGGLALVVLLVGAGLWFFVLKPPPPTRPALPVSTTSNNRANADAAADVQKTLTDEGAGKKIVAKPTLAQRRSEALTLLDNLATRETSRSRVRARQWTATAYAAAGKSAETRDQIERLRSASGNARFLEVVPLVELAWFELKAGRTDAANGLIAEAITAASSLPERERNRYEAAVQLASVLVATARVAEAKRLVEASTDNSPIADQVASQQIVRSLGSYNLDELGTGQPFAPWQSPLWTAATVECAARGFPDQALTWAISHSDVESRVESVILWTHAVVDASVRTKTAGLTERIDAAIAKLPTAGQARAWARASARLSHAGDKPGAEAALKKAKDLLDSVTVPPPRVLTSEKDVFSANPDEAPNFSMAALAAIEIAAAESGLGRDQESMAQVIRALNFASASAPLPTAVRQKIVEADGGGASLVRQRLKTAFELGTTNQVNAKFREYREELAQLEKRARRRFELQSSLFEAAAGWKIQIPLWEELQRRTQLNDPQLQEPWFTSEVPRTLIASLSASSDTSKQAKASEITKRLQELKVASDFTQDFRLATSVFATTGNLDQLKQWFAATSGKSLDRTWLDRWTVRMVCRAARAGHFTAAAGMIPLIRSPNAQEDAAECLGGMSLPLGKSDETWTLIQEADFPPATQAALCFGFMMGTSTNATAAAIPVSLAN